MNLMRIRVTNPANETELIGRVTWARQISLTLENLDEYQRVEEIPMRKFPGEMRSLKMIEKKKEGDHVGERRKSEVKSPQITWLTLRLK